MYGAFSYTPQFLLRPTWVIQPALLLLFLTASARSTFMLKGNLVVSCAAWVQLSSLDASGVGTAALREREREEASGVPFFCTSLWKFALAQSCLKLKAHLPGFRGREPPCSWFNRITRLIASPDLALDWFPSNIPPITVMIFFFPAVWKWPAAGVLFFLFFFWFYFCAPICASEDWQYVIWGQTLRFSFFSFWRSGLSLSWNSLLYSIF